MMTGKKRMNRGNSVNESERSEKNVETMPKAYPQAHAHPTILLPEPTPKPIPKPTLPFSACLSYHRTFPTTG